MGVLVFIVAIGFGFWAAIGNAWYWYVLAPALLLGVSSLVCTSCLQAVTRLYALVVVQGTHRIRNAIVLLALNGTWWLIGYGLSYFVLTSHVKTLIFFAVCMIMATVVAYGDGQFELAVERERSLHEFHRIMSSDGEKKSEPEDK